MTNEIILPPLKNIISRLKDIIRHSYISKMVIHGIKTAIVGRPNVGKSSVLNMLLDEDKAIVTDIEGTTRDLVEGKLSLGNVTLDLIDTAGIRDHSTDLVEQIGINKSKKLIDEAELILLVLDSSMALTDTDKLLLDLTKDKRRIIIANKADKNSVIELDDAIYISAKTHDGLFELENRIIDICSFNEFNVADQNYTSNVRHITLLKKAMESLEKAMESCKLQMGVDMVEIDIKDAFDQLGEIVGKNYSDEILDNLFKNFCVGK
jgi:tRNA modification GTPase